MAGVCTSSLGSGSDKMVGMKNWGYYLVGLFLGFVILVVSQMPSGQLQMVACDVGQGDAILLSKESIQVLVDGGPSSDKILACLEKYVPFYDRTIELIVLTNTDFDHLNGLSAVLKRYEVMEFVTADGVHESAALTKLIAQLSESGVGVRGVEQGDKLRLGPVGEESTLELRVLWPPEVVEEYVAVFSNQMEMVQREQILGASAKRGHLNERSVVLLLLEDKSKILLMGDAGDQAEKVMLLRDNLPNVDILKVGHHGSKYASSQEFLERVRPEIAVISVGGKNTYGHPTEETLERLRQVGAEVRRTDEGGAIVLNW